MDIYENLSFFFHTETYYGMKESNLRYFKESLMNDNHIIVESLFYNIALVTICFIIEKVLIISHSSE